MELFFVFWVVLSPACCGIMAYKKGRRVWLWVLLGVCLGFFAVMRILFLPSTHSPLYALRNSRKAQEEELLKFYRGRAGTVHDVASSSGWQLGDTYQGNDLGDS